MSSERSTSRHVFIDHLRVVLTALVVLHHTAIVYGGSGSWYWVEQRDGATVPLLLFNAVNQSYFMGLFFLLAGYFTPKSYDRKGARRFLSDRFTRLGVPLLCYVFIISPITNALARTGDGHAFLPSLWATIRSRDFEPGPLWFAEALLIFALVYAAWRSWGPRPGRTLERVPRWTTLLASATAVALASFLVRLRVPVGHTVAFLQLGYFPAYILLFAVGCMAARSQLLERVTARDARPWLIVSIVMFILLPIIVAARGDSGPFTGGWSLNAAFYALWDPLIAWGIMLTLLWFVRERWSTESRAMAGAGRRAYAAYIIHPPVVVALTLLAHSWAAAPLLKFGVVGAAACLAAFTVAAVLLLIPGSQRVL